MWGSGGVRARVCDEFRSEERHECGDVRVGHCLDGRDGDMRAGALVIDTLGLSRLLLQ